LVENEGGETEMDLLERPSPQPSTSKSAQDVHNPLSSIDLVGGPFAVIESDPGMPHHAPPFHILTRAHLQAYSPL